MNSRYFIIALLFIFLFACKKEEESVGYIAPEISNGSTAHTTFEFSGVMNVDKYDSLWNPITNYNVNLVESKMLKQVDNYSLSTNFNGASLKGETLNSILVEVINNNFSTYNAGTGIFELGVLNGYFTSNDSLYYRVLFETIDNNKIYLKYEGNLINSY
ncbi:MAG: hypothetical protein H6586_00980 [Flavobacteriales bacterium]|nr:hypothetical protein [Flavobacteriales bacterium]